MARQSRKSLQKKLKRKVPKGVVHVQASFNNTIITITNLKGEVISWSSAGACGFKGARKGTPFAAKTAAEEQLNNLEELTFLLILLLSKVYASHKLGLPRALVFRLTSEAWKA